MVTKLEMLRQTSADLGLIRTIEQVPAGFDCPIHEVPIVEHHVETIAGWQAVMVCPVHDGSCSYSPDQDPTPIEPPEGAVDDKRTANATRPNEGGF